MHLITMAHAGEALSVIEKFKLNRLKEDLYQNDKIVLVITGEGPFEAATKTALAISRFHITHIINAGIAGSLHDNVKVGDVVSLRTIYLLKDWKPEFKTFQSDPQGLDCLTSFERILDQEKARILQGVGAIVDREAWGVAFAAKMASVPFQSIKVISDLAGSLGACELVKESAREFSEKLAAHLESMLDSSEEKVKTHFHLEGFHFTFSTQEQFRKLTNKLMIKHEMTYGDVLEQLPLSQLRELEITPKERSKRLLNLLEEKVDPVKALLNKKMETLIAVFQKEGLKVSYDPQWENTQLTISFEASNDSDLKEKAEALKNLTLKNFSDIMEGKIDVE